MAIATLSLPQSCYNPFSSSITISSSFPSSVPAKSHSFFMLGFKNTPAKTVINCSSSNTGPNFDGNFRPQTSTMEAFNLANDEAAVLKPSFKWQRVLLKVSGEALAGDCEQNVDPKVTF